MAAVVELRRVADRFEAGRVDPPADLADLLGEREHQGEDVLGDRAVDPPPERLDRNPARRAGVQVDVAEIGAEFLDDPEVGRAVELRRAEGHALDDRALGVRKRGPERVGIVRHAKLGRENRSRAGAQRVPPGVEIGQIDREIVRDGGLPVGGRVRVEDDLDVADDRVVFGDDDGQVSSPSALGGSSLDTALRAYSG